MARVGLSGADVEKGDGTGEGGKQSGGRWTSVVVVQDRQAQGRRGQSRSGFERAELPSTPAGSSSEGGDRAFRVQSTRNAIVGRAIALVHALTTPELVSERCQALAVELSVRWTCRGIDEGVKGRGW